jgi:hypothetical protein
VNTKLTLGCPADGDETRLLDRAQIPGLKVTWPEARTLVITVNACNSSDEPIVTDIRLFAACFDRTRKPPKNRDDQVKLALSRQPFLVLERQVVPDPSMCLGTVWSTGPYEYLLAEGVEDVALVAKLNRPGHRDMIDSHELHKHSGIATWFGHLPDFESCDRKS